MLRPHSFIAAALAVACLATTLALPISARASEEGKRNTTLGLGAAAAALLLTQKNKLPGLLAAGGAVYAYTQYQNDINKRHQRERWAAEHRYSNHYHRTHHRTHRHYNR